MQFCKQKNLHFKESKVRYCLKKNGSYFNPTVLRCCPISRTISWFVRSIILDCTSSPEGEEVPLCSEQPFEAGWDCCCCILGSTIRDFFLGGGASPPSSGSPFEARLAKESPWFNLFSLHPDILIAWAKGTGTRAQSIDNTAVPCNVWDARLGLNHGPLDRPHSWSLGRAAQKKK